MPRESNAYAYALTPHPCENNNYHVCEGSNCGGTYSEDRYGGGCDANGCDYNPYRMGNPDFYGPGKTIDTTKKFTVITRFSPDRMYQVFIQDGRTIEVPGAKWAGVPETSEITPEYCERQFAVFNERDRFNEVGGYPQLNAALNIPMTLVMSIWSDVSFPLLRPQASEHAKLMFRDSTTPICSGSTQPTLPRGLESRVPNVDLVPQLLVSPPRLSSSSPTRRSSGPTFASVPSAAPTLFKRTEGRPEVVYDIGRFGSVSKTTLSGRCLRFPLYITSLLPLPAPFFPSGFVP